jgi:drug/metabolite transporter (DMT)-like permease
MPEGQKRLVPGMTRGGFRFQLFMWAILTLNPIWQLASRPNEPWTEFYVLMVAMLILCVAALAYLLYARYRDSHFWDEEEARRAEWDRRGRQL